MSEDYNKFRAAEHLRRQAIDLWGLESQQCERMSEVVDFWFRRWINAGSPIDNLTETLLMDRIGAAYRDMQESARK